MFSVTNKEVIGKIKKVKRHLEYVFHRIIPEKKISKQQAELDFWGTLYNEIAKAPRTVDVFQRISSSFPLEKRKEFHLIGERWAHLDIRQRLLELGRTISFPRYKNDFNIGDNDFAGKCVLDVGCGAMGALTWFESEFRVGVDELIIEYQKIGYPLDAHPILYVKGVAEDLPFPDSQFDVVISINALDHVENFETAISEIHRVLKSDGKIYLNFNYQSKPTTTEPIVLSDERVERALFPYFIFTKVKSETTEFAYSKNCYHGSVRK